MVERGKRDLISIFYYYIRKKWFSEEDVSLCVLKKNFLDFNRNPLNVSDLHNQRGSKRMYILKKCI